MENNVTNNGHDPRSSFAMGSTYKLLEKLQSTHQDRKIFQTYRQEKIIMSYIMVLSMIFSFLPKKKAFITILIVFPQLYDSISDEQVQNNPNLESLIKISESSCEAQCKTELMHN